MTNNLIKAIEKIVNSDTGYQIAKTVGVRPHQINRLKNGDKKIENISLNLAKKILDAYADVSITLKSE